jgi:3-methyladenine DNA glycosylase AlkD
MGTIFKLAKEYIDMPLTEIERMLESPIHEMRVGAVSILDWQARWKKTPEARRQEIYHLYLRRHDRINNWDLVDRAAPHVVGGYLYDKSREPLYHLAESSDLWERRTAIVSTSFFLRKGDLEDTFAIAERLIDDPEDLIQKAVGGWLREAGKKDRDRLTAFLDQHSARMPKTMLRYATEHLTQDLRDQYRNRSQQ